MLSRCVNGFHGHTYNRIVPKLLERYFYRDEDGNWRQSRVEKEIQKADKISAKQAQNVSKRWTNRDQNNETSLKNKEFPNTTVIPPQSQSQLDTNVSNNIKREQAPVDILAEAMSPETAKDLVAHRKAKKSPLTAGSAKALVKQFQKYGDPEGAAQAMMANGWTGFKPEWMQSNQRDGPSKPVERGGFASLMAKSIGIKGDGREERNIDRNVSVFPIGSVEKRGNGSDASDGLSPNAVQLLVANSFRSV
jgi:uncharacterized protein YdaU (DUF1376 family)